MMKVSDREVTFSSCSGIGAAWPGPPAGAGRDSCTMVRALPDPGRAAAAGRGPPDGKRSESMTRGRPAILIDARVNGMPGAHGIARSVMKLAAHLEPADDGLAVKVLVNPARPQTFPLSDLP